MIFYNKLLASIVEIDIDFYQVASIKGDSKIDVKNGKKKRDRRSQRGESQRNQVRTTKF